MSLTGQCGAAALGLLGLLCLCCLLVMWHDMHDRRIPNRLCLVIALLAIPSWLASGNEFWSTAARQVLLVLVVGLPVLGLYALRVMGGGDVKLIAALVLWLPPVLVPGFLIATLLIGGLVGLVTLGVQRWCDMEREVSVPYGVAIVAGAFAVLFPRTASCLMAA